MSHPRRWSLGGELALVDLPFLLLALLSIALTLWVSWQLDGGAAAVNEAGRMSMHAYRMSLFAGSGKDFVLPQRVADFERSLELLRHGDLERALFVPWDDRVRAARRGRNGLQRNSPPMDDAGFPPSRERGHSEFGSHAFSWRAVINQGKP